MWIITVWQHILRAVTVKGFKNCCISNAVDQSDDNINIPSKKCTLMITIELIYVLNDVSLEAYFGWYTDCKNMHGMNNIKFDDNML
jgi:hypothetical protein